MVYTPEEKVRMDQLVKAFGNYIAASEGMDIAYSEKTGYVCLAIAETADNVFFPLGSFDDMLQMFFFDILSDEVNLTFARNPTLTCRTMDYSAANRWLRTILSTLNADRKYALRELEILYEYWKTQKLLP